jgi:integrase
MFYLGRFGSVESRAEYNRIISEWLAGTPQATPPAPSASKATQTDLAVGELILAYFRHCEQYYVKNGEATNQVCMIRLALKVLNRLYGHTSVRDFGPLALKACRAEFVSQGLSRRECNRRTNLIKQAFRWATENELAPPGVFHALQAVAGLRKGRCKAPEPAPIGPVPDEVVDRTIEHLNPTVAAMVRLQRLTGMRPGEVVIMRTCDLNTSVPIWEYRPGAHKGEHHEKDRVVMLGPRAQAIVKEWLKTDLEAFLFSPRESLAGHQAERRKARQTPLWPSHKAAQARKRKPQPSRAPRDRYDVCSYRRAIVRACDLASPHPTLSEIPENDLTDAQRKELKAWHKAHRWHPHALRHSAGTAIRRRYGLEAAQACLGHSELGATQVYAERNLDAAREVMREIG